MRWAPATFKGKSIWAKVNDEGELLQTGGRSPIRYSKQDGAKVYRANSSGVTLTGGEAIELGAGVSASPKPASSNRSGLGSAKNRTAAQKQRAVELAAELVSSFSDDAVVAFTDGACKGNPGPAGSGVALKLPSGETLTRSEYLGTATNNVAELTALSIAMDMAEAAGVPKSVQLELCTDSKYSHGVLVLGWKAKKNVDLILGIRQKIAQRGNVRIHWVAGHAGIPENELADELATSAVERRASC